MIKDREYLCSINKFNKPVQVEGQKAIGYRLMELITMDPGDNPLHPEMGVGLRSFRYGIDNLSNLEKKIAEQIDQYLPMYRVTDIALVISPDKILSVEISIGDMTYVYDSAETNNPITIDEIADN